MLETILTAIATGFGKVIGKFIGIFVSNKAKRIFQTLPAPFLLSKLARKGKMLSSSDLIKFYSAETPYSICLCGKHWEFAANKVLSPINNGRVDRQNISIKVSSSTKRLDGELDRLTKPRLEEIKEAREKMKLFDGSPWCLNAISRGEDSVVLSAGKCSYFDSLRTNFSMDAYVAEADKTLRNYLHGKKRKFETFSHSRLPNHMGVVALIETSDGQIIAQKRSADVSIRPNSLSASVSGTVELNDFISERRGQNLENIARALAREAFGELGVEFGNNHKDFIFLGLMREFYRGGFPDFYFYAKSNNTFSEIIESSRYADERHEIYGLVAYDFRSADFLRDPRAERYDFEKRIHNLLSITEKKSNVTLSLGIALVFEHFAASSEA